MGRNCSQTSLLVHGSGFSRPDKESAELGVGSFERLYIRLLFGGGRVVEGWNQHGMATVLITSQSRTPARNVFYRHNLLATWRWPYRCWYSHTSFHGRRFTPEIVTGWGGRWHLGHTVWSCGSWGVINFLKGVCLFFYFNCCLKKIEKWYK